MGEIKVTRRQLKKDDAYVAADAFESMRTEVKLKPRGEFLELAYVAQALNMAHEKGAPADARVTGVEWLEDGIAFELTWGPEMTKNTLVRPHDFDYSHHG